MLEPRVSRVVVAEIGVELHRDIICDGGGGHTEGGENLPHPAAVTACQIIVDRDQVAAAPGQRVEVERGGGDKRLALAGLHFGDLALVEHNSADKLNIVVTLAERSLGGFPDRRKRLRQEVVQRLAGGETL